MRRFFMLCQDVEVGFSNVSAIRINQARIQKFLGEGEIFVELRRFDKHLIKTQEKKAPQGKILDSFSPRHF